MAKLVFFFFSGLFGAGYAMWAELAGHHDGFVIGLIVTVVSIVGCGLYDFENRP